MLSIAQDLVNQLTPYQTALSSALDVATSLPLVGSQLADVQEFNSILQNSLSSINTQTQGIVNNGHYDVAVPLSTLAKTFTFDLGLDAFLQVSAAGGVNVAINPVLTVGFDVQNGVASLDALQTSLDIGFNVSLPGFQATMSLNGLLYTRAVDAGTSFQGNLGFDLDGANGVTARFSGEAHVLMGLTLSFIDPAENASFNPTFRTTLDLDWGIDTQTNQLLAPSISLVDFGLEADSFLQGFLGDVVTTVQKFTKPIQPFIDIFQTPVPILSAFGGSETIGTLMLKGANVSQEQQDRFALMVQIVDAVNTIDLGGGTGGAVIPFGTITLTGDAQQAGGFGFDTSQVTNTIDDILNSPALQAVEDAIETVGNYTGVNSSAGFKFELLENPGPVIGAILTGQIETLFSFSIGRQHFELAPSIGVGIKDLLGVFLSAGIIFDANLTMGYDTAGLIAVAQNPNDPSKLLHGFYFDNSIDTTAPPIPNHAPVRKTGLHLQGLMELSASVVATVSGGLYANIDVELVNTDASDHVHLDTMIGNLASGGKVFKLGGKVYASADISLTLPNPVGPDITLFSYNLGYEELLNFDPPPPPDLGVPVTVIDVTNQHTLQLDVNKMGVGTRIVSVRPYYNLSVDIGGTTVETDGIRVDYPNEIYFFVQRKSDLTTNYYNLVTLSGAVPDGVSINIADPFRVFYDEGAVNPYPAQTKPGVLLVGGKNVIYNYSELADGTNPNVLLVGGYGSNTLTGGTMSFGNFIPADRIAGAKAHFGNISGFDASGASLINSVVDAAIAPVNPAGIIGAKITGRRGGLMIGGPGNNSFIAVGPGAYEMIGGTWVNSFDISPSFNGAPATYSIDGGPFGQSQLIVRVPPGELADFENGTVPDKYNPAFKALDIFANAGLTATAHGIQSVLAFGAVGSTIIIGDTSELDMKFSIRGSGTTKFGGSVAPDVLDVSARYQSAAFYSYATRKHRTAAILLPYDLVTFADDIDNFFIMHPGYTWQEGDPGAVVAHYQYTYVDGPIYSISRTFGTNNRTQIIEWNIGDTDNSKLVLDGRGASDQYRIAIGTGTFLDVTVDDSDESTQNSLLVEAREERLVNKQATLTDNALRLEYFTPILAVQNITPYLYYFSSVAYLPTVYFDANTDITFASAYPFDKTIVDRPNGTQHATILIDTIQTPASMPYFQSMGRAYDVERPELGWYISTPTRTLDVLANAGNLTVQRIQSFSESLPTRVYSNTGTISLNDNQIWAGFHDTYTIYGNAGTLNINNAVDGAFGIWLGGLVRIIDILANSGAINIQTTVIPTLYNNALDTQVNVGENGSLANIQGTISLANSNGRFGLKIDDRNGAATPWIVDSGSTVIGNLVLNYDGTNEEFDGYSTYEAFTGAGSPVTLFQVPPFYRRRLNGVNFPSLQLSGAPAEIYSRSGDVVSIPLSSSGSPSGVATYTASNLPPGLSINSTTGLISGTIHSQAHLAGSYPTAVIVTKGGYSRGLHIDWHVTEITLTGPAFRLDHVGDAVNLLIQATTISGNAVTFSAEDLPSGLAIDPATGVVSGTVAGAIGGAETHFSKITATNGNDVLSLTIEWIVVPAGQSNFIQLPYLGDQTNRETNFVSFYVTASSTLGLPLDYSVQGLPPSVRLFYDDFDDEYYLAGSIQPGAASNSPYHVTITATDGFWSDDVSFDWFVYGATSVNVVDPGDRSNLIGDAVALQIQASSSLGQALTFTATGLPDGLSIDPQTGIISGVVSPLATLPNVFDVSVSVTDGSSTHGATFLWTIASSASPSTVSLPILGGGGFFDVTTSAGTILNATISADAGTATLPGISFPFGFLSFTIVGVTLGAAVDVTITGLDVGQLTEYFKYGATPAYPGDHWYNFLIGQQTDDDSPVGTGMEIVGGDLVLHLIDGSRGDDDSSMNGAITDIGGPAFGEPTLQLGDYNRDTVVNAADYVVWRNSIHQSGLTPYDGADGNGDGEIDRDDYLVWKARYGETLPSPAAGTAAASFAAADLIHETSEPLIAVSLEAPTSRLGADLSPMRELTFAIGSQGSTKDVRHSRSAARVNSVPLATSGDDQLLVLLAIDRIGSIPPSSISLATDSAGENDLNAGRNSGLASLAEEPLAVALAEWP